MNAKQLVGALLETQPVRSLCENTADAEAFAQETGMTFNPANQVSGARMSANMSDRDREAFAGIPRTWEFTDKRPQSPTAGMTFYVNVGTPLEQIKQRYQQKAAEWIDLSKPKSAFGIHKNNPVDAIAQQKKLRNEWE